MSGLSNYSNIDTSGVFKSYHHSQAVSSKTWTITHNLGTKTPLLQVYDSTYTLINYNSAVSDSAGNVLTVTLPSNKIGYAIVVGA